MPQQKHVAAVRRNHERAAGEMALRDAAIERIAVGADERKDLLEVRRFPRIHRAVSAKLVGKRHGTGNSRGLLRSCGFVTLLAKEAHMELVAINDAKTLFVSGAIDDWDEIHKNRINTIVDMDGGVDPGVPEAPNAILYVYFPILDEELPCVKKLHAVGKMVADLVQKQQGVLVHCRMGFNRSNLVIATALTYLGMSGPQAVEHLQKLRPGALYNENFAEYIRALGSGASV
jgi:predicted protein tyrosine phosphatase